MIDNILVILVAVVLSVITSVSLTWFFLARKFDRRISDIESSVVRDVMESSPKLTEQVLQAAERLRRISTSNTTMGWIMREARRLHGLPG